MDNFFLSGRKKSIVSRGSEKEEEKKRPVPVLFESKNLKIGDFSDFSEFKEKSRPLGDKIGTFSDLSDHNGQYKIPGSLERQKRKGESQFGREGESQIKCDFSRGPMGQNDRR